MSAAQTRQVLAEGRSKARSTKHAEKDSNRAEVEKILTRMESTGKRLTNVQITDKAGLDESWLYATRHRDIKKRADDIRAAISKQRRAQQTDDRSEIELALQVENDSLHQQVRDLTQRLRINKAALAESRSQQLSQDDSVVDLTAAKTLKDSNDLLDAELAAQKIKLRQIEAEKKVELRRTKRDHNNTKSAFEKARREIERLQSILDQLGDEPDEQFADEQMQQVIASWQKDT
jgi:hypothetical protein